MVCRRFSWTPYHFSYTWSALGFGLTHRTTRSHSQIWNSINHIWLHHTGKIVIKYLHHTAKSEISYQVLTFKTRVQPNKYGFETIFSTSHFKTAFLHSFIFRNIRYRTHSAQFIRPKSSKLSIYDRTLPFKPILLDGRRNVEKNNTNLRWHMSSTSSLETQGILLWLCRAAIASLLQSFSNALHSYKIFSNLTQIKIIPSNSTRSSSLRRTLAFVEEFTPKVCVIASTTEINRGTYVWNRQNFTHIFHSNAQFLLLHLKCIFFKEPLAKII